MQISGFPRETEVVCLSPSMPAIACDYQYTAYIENSTLKFYRLAARNENDLYYLTAI